MKNFIQDGRIIDVVAPSGGLTSGAFYAKAGLIGVVQSTVLEGETTTVDRIGVSTQPKVTGTAWVQGDPLYWDAVASKFTKVALGNLPVGFAAAAAASADATGAVFIGPAGASGLKVAGGQHTTIDADDTVVTGLALVLAAVANLEDAPVIGADRAQAVIGDQAGAPAAGSIQIKTFKPTAAGDATPVAATTFSKKVNWVAFGY